jgi:hypothetical protein
MSRRCRSVLGRAGTLLAVVTGSIAFAVPVATATLPPQGGGGCHMVTNPGSSDLYHMMAGASNGAGQTKMLVMLSGFSTDQPCGL